MLRKKTGIRDHSSDGRLNRVDVSLSWGCHGPAKIELWVVKSLQI